MSVNVFPLTRMPLASRSLRRVASRAVPVQRAESGKGYPIRRRLTPGRRWAMDFGPMSEAAGEVQELARFAAIHGGRYDTFLLRDPLDYQVSDHGFGVGDGSTTVFQLQRAMAGSVSDALGTWPLVTVGRSNLLTYSEDLSNAAWSKQESSVLSNFAVGPSGELTADALLESSATSAHYAVQTYTTSESTDEVGSVYAKGNATRSQMRIEMSGRDGAAGYADFDLLAGTVHATSGVTAGVESVGDGWCRPWMTKNTGAGASPTTFLVALLNGWQPSYGGDGASGIALWGAMVERFVSQPRRYIYSGSSAGVQWPAFWPALGDGFEPVTEPLWRSVSVKKDGADVSFTPGSNGTVTLSPAPSLYQALTWSGSFYRRVRFAADDLELERIASGLWRSGRIELEEEPA